MEQPCRVGVLYPSTGAEDDYFRMARLLTPRAEVVMAHTEGPDRHEPHIGKLIGGSNYLLAGAAQLKPHNVDVCTWACTSGSFTHGLHGARKQATEVADFLQVPASSTSLAFANSTLAMGFTRVAVAATYPQEHASAFCAFLEEAGIDVVHLGAMGIWTGIEVGDVGPEPVLEFLEANDHEKAEAVLVPDTALHTVAFLTELEEAVGKPVLTANQVSFWECLRQTARLRPQPGLGRLFEMEGDTHATTY